MRLLGGTVNITNSNLNYNNANEGGAIWGATVNITNSNLNYNSANYDGGAIWGDVTATNSTFLKNRSNRSGGAVYGYEIFIINSNLSYNTAKEEGGAIYSWDFNNVTIKNNRFTQNYAVDGSAIYVCNDKYFSNIIIEKTIVKNIFVQNKANTSDKKAIVNNGINNTIINNINDKTSTYYSTIFLETGTKNTIISNNIFDYKENATIITLNPIKGIIGETITLKATLTDTYHNLINGGNLAFKLNGKTLRSDGRFDSKASAMKFSVKNGVVTYTIKADLYLRNAKNLTASYSGTSTYRETTSSSVTAQIQKRYAQVTVTSTPSIAKQYETLTFTVKAKDTTKNGKNNTLIYTDTKVMLKVNGVTLKDAKGKILYLTLDKNAQTTYKYTIPKGTGGITASKKARNYTVTAIFIGENYYPGAKNTTKFQVARSATYVNITQAKVTKTNVLTVKATLKDYKQNNLIGTNKVTIKINGKSYTKNGKPVYWSVKNGNVDLTGIQVDPKTTIKRVLLVTGERQAYLEGRAETYHIIRT